MVRRFRENDLAYIMQIWLDINIKAHNFIAKEYWESNYKIVREVLPQAEVYVYEDDNTHEVVGFIGLTDNHIEGIFVNDGSQSKGIGTQLLGFVKEMKSTLDLCVYQKNVRAIRFYQGEQFKIQSENIDPETNEREFKMIWNK